MKYHIISFTTLPGLRYQEMSDNSGEEFYFTELNKLFGEALKSKKTLTVNLDGTEGYPPSFIDESFGNLVYDFGLKKVNKNLLIESNEEPDWIDIIKKEIFPQWEEKRKSKVERKTTRPESDKIFFIDDRDGELKERNV